MVKPVFTCAACGRRIPWIQVKEDGRWVQLYPGTPEADFYAVTHPDLYTVCFRCVPKEKAEELAAQE